MYRGTTPTINIEVEGAQLSDYADIWITIKQSHITQITRKLSDGSMIIQDNMISFTLTQDETLMFGANNKVRLQLRAITPDGIAVASDIIDTTIGEILKEGVITDDNIAP